MFPYLYRAPRRIGERNPPAASAVRFLISIDRLREG
jgi:hypothetical protein